MIVKRSSPKNGSTIQEINSKIGDPPDYTLNRFKIKSRQSLAIWRENDWVMGDDPRGWFQWYCRYWLGRRSECDEFQKKRWRAFKRHKGQIEKIVLRRIIVVALNSAKHCCNGHMIHLSRLLYVLYILYKYTFTILFVPVYKIEGSRKIEYNNCKLHFINNQQKLLVETTLHQAFLLH